MTTHKRIGIDARLLTQTGVGVYTRNLLLELSKIADPMYSFFIYIRPEDEEMLPPLPQNSTIRYSNARWHSLSEQTLFLYQLMNDKLDVMHFCYFSMPLFYSRRFVITIHDVIPYKHTTGTASTKNSMIYFFKHWVYKKILINALKKAVRIFVPTDAVKHDIISLFSFVPQDKIIRTYEGVDSLLAKAIPAASKSIPSKPFFLYVGNYYPHKNVPFLINAFSKSNTNASLVLCGPEDYFSSQIDALIRKTGSTRIERISDTTLDERAYLYSNATALVHPSRDEGFGLPLIEASYFGCPILASDIPVFREICPDARFFSLDSTTQLIAMLEGSLNISMSHKPQINPQFSFTSMAKETYNQYKLSL